MRKLFIGGLPHSFTTERLRDAFQNYGELIDYVVMKDSHTNESRGFGFVEFATEESADAILAARPFRIDGREVDIRRAMPKNANQATIHEKTKRLFIGGMDKSVVEDDLRRYYEENFSKYGRVESVDIKRDRDSNTSKGFGFIAFDSEDAVDAILLKDPRPSAFGFKCEVKKAENRNSDNRQRQNVRGGRDRGRMNKRNFNEREDFNPRMDYSRRSPRRQEYDVYGYQPDYGRQYYPPQEPYPPYGAVPRGMPMERDYPPQRNMGRPRFPEREGINRPYRSHY